MTEPADPPKKRRARKTPEVDIFIDETVPVARRSFDEKRHAPQVGIVGRVVGNKTHAPANIVGLLLFGLLILLAIVIMSIVIRGKDDDLLKAVVIIGQLVGPLVGFLFGRRMRDP